jgi:hypothetical protein
VYQLFISDQPKIMMNEAKNWSVCLRYANHGNDILCEDFSYDRRIWALFFLPQGRIASVLGPHLGSRIVFEHFITVELFYDPWNWNNFGIFPVRFFTFTAFEKAINIIDLKFGECRRENYKIPVKRSFELSDQTTSLTTPSDFQKGFASFNLSRFPPFRDDDIFFGIRV